MNNRIGIVIPALNESRIIKDVILPCKKFGTVIVVDDGSADNTTDIAKKNGAIVLRHPINMGVGFATITGNKYTIDSLGCNILINIDADGQHPPEIIPELIKKIDEGYDIVFGTRMKDNQDMPTVKKIGNYIISSLNNLIFNIHLSDSQTGLRAVSKTAWEKIQLKCDGYSICSEFACEVGRTNLRYCEIPIKAVYDDWTKIKGTNIFHGFRIIYDSIVIKVNR